MQREKVKYPAGGRRWKQDLAPAARKKKQGPSFRDDGTVEQRGFSIWGTPTVERQASYWWAADPWRADPFTVAELKPGDFTRMESPGWTIHEPAALTCST